MVGIDDHGYFNYVTLDGDSCDKQAGGEQTSEHIVDSQTIDSNSGSEEEEEEGEEEEEEGGREKVVEEVKEERPTDGSNPDREDEGGERCSKQVHSHVECEIGGEEKRSPSAVEGRADIGTNCIREADDSPNFVKPKSDCTEIHDKGQADASHNINRITVSASDQLEPKTPNKYSALVDNKQKDRDEEGLKKSRLYISTDARPSSPPSDLRSRTPSNKPAVPWIAQSSTTGYSSHVNSSKYKYSCKLSPPQTSPPSGLALSALDRQMALVMSSMPLALIARSKNSSSPTATGYFPTTSGMPSPRTEDQPLDLSKKPDKDRRNSDLDDYEKQPLSPAVSRQHKSVLSSVVSSPSSTTTNGFSSLQSLQERFGGEFPLGKTHQPRGSVIPLQPSLAPKTSSSGSIHTLATDHTPVRQPGAQRYKQAASSRGVAWFQKQDRTNALCRVSPSPPPKVERKVRPHTASPLINPVDDVKETTDGDGGEGGESAGSKHTIHRCSCHKTFSSLYGLSVHLQETGHAPGASRSASLMDYPKLVRGQDMWLNQESEQTRRILRCMQCGESFKSLPLLTVHMMQTQHYTKIVSSEHGRRSHKCSTYCDRELDKECIFKCKVCHEAFTDMEGLANHMIVSGHHKKQASSRHSAHASVTSSQTVGPTLSEVTSLTRHGKRKRFLPDDVAAAAAAAAVAAISPTSVTTSVSLPNSSQSCLDFKGKQGISAGVGKCELSNDTFVNGFHLSGLRGSASLSEETPSDPTKTILCDSCGKRYDAFIFDAHVRACLRQRAEVIDALKNKLAVEEALLSRSESKLLKSGFTLSSSATAAGLQEEQLLPKSGKVLKREPENFLGVGYNRTDSMNEDDNQASRKTVSNMGLLPSRNSSPFVAQTPPRSPVGETSPSTKAKICDLIEVPLKKWYCSQRGESSPGCSSNVSDSELTQKEVHLHSPKESYRPPAESVWATRRTARQEGPQVPNTLDDSPNVISSSPVSSRKRKLSETESLASGSSCDATCDKARPTKEGHGAELRDNLTPGLSNIPPESPVDFTSSALHKLDMFSRGLQLSPPRRTTVSPDEVKSSVPHTAAGNKAAKRRESCNLNRNSSSRTSSISKSPLAASTSPVALSKSQGSTEPLKEVTFDIIDPNSGSGEIASSSSAIEAMESFIHKSFSAKSDLRTSNLATMFSPFRTCFPLPGSLPGQVPTDPSDPALSCFAKFSKFFRMVPGVSSLSDISTPRPSDQKPRNSVQSSLDFSSPTHLIAESKSGSLSDAHKSKITSHHKASSASSIPSVKTSRASPFSTRPVKNSVPNNLVGLKGADCNAPVKKYKYSSLNPEDVAKQMFAGGNHHKSGKYFNSYSSIASSSPMAVSLNRLVRDNSKNVTPESSALPSTSDLEKLQDGLKRKRKLSQCLDLSERRNTIKKEYISDEDDKDSRILETKEFDIKGGQKDLEKPSDKDSSNLETKEFDIKGGQKDLEKPPDKDRLKKEFVEDTCGSTSGSPKPLDPESESTEKSPFPDNDKDGDLKKITETKFKTVISECQSSNNTDKISNAVDKSLDLDSDTGVNEDDQSNTDGKVQNRKNIEKITPKSDREKFYLCDQQSLSPRELSASNSDKKGQDEGDFVKQTRDGVETATEVNEKDTSQDEDRASKTDPKLSKEQDLIIERTDVATSPSLSAVHGEDNDEDSECSENTTDGIISSEVKRHSGMQAEETGDEDTTTFRKFASPHRTSHSPASDSAPIQSEDECLTDKQDDNDENDEERAEADKKKSKSARSSGPSCSSSAPVKGKSKHRLISEENVNKKKSKKKSSALDSLSTFVYSQALTSEHPLDSLQKLLSTNDLNPAQDGQKKCLNSSSAASKSSPSFAPKISEQACSSIKKPQATFPHSNIGLSPLNLSTSVNTCSSNVESDTGTGSKTSETGNDAGCASDDSDGVPENLACEDIEAGADVEAGGSGAASDGEGSDYKCTACNRQFASKGSYRYHLSRCQLSGVKKLGIKEAFNMSPYVYLPLDHTAKFSKYYQMAHELANKGK
ncbi:protein tiptop [Plakobranchus ocellatus]|uniref:Protein tiptop n=1 Tax=Plakobranchus ocellatus TaxID=259542 RepID=A0AAV3ZL82_9GAST|nr:protein tiptop [Plakobranchus ocellatus]